MDWKEWDGGRHGAEREDAKGKRDAKKRNEGSGEMKEGEGKRTSLPMRASPGQGAPAGRRGRPAADQSR